MAWPTAGARTKNWVTEIMTDADLEGQYDLLWAYLNDSLNGTSGHGHTGGENDGIKIVLTTSVSGTLPIANGGTGVTTLTALCNLVYPVGIVITLGVSTNPNTLLGFGTWAAIAGKVIVGIDNTQTEFDTLNETGGEKMHTLTAGETPVLGGTFAAESTGGAGGNNYPGTQFLNTTKNYNVSVNPGGGGGHNNLQPYIVKYVWERTA